MCQFLRQSNKYLSSGSDYTFWMTSSSMSLECQRGTMTLVALSFWWNIFIIYLMEELHAVCRSPRNHCLICLILLLNFETPEPNHLHRIYLDSTFWVQMLFSSAPQTSYWSSTLGAPWFIISLYLRHYLLEGFHNSARKVCPLILLLFLIMEIVPLTSKVPQFSLCVFISFFFDLKFPESPYYLCVLVAVSDSPEILRIYVSIFYPIYVSTCINIRFLSIPYWFDTL